MEKQYQAVAIGNVILDAFLRIHEPNRFVHIDQGKKTLCFRYGEKIHVGSCDFLLGGNACNVGVGLGRLGIKTALLAEVGDDEFSQKITSGLLKEPIDSTTVIHTTGAPASFAVGINFEKERTLFVEHVHRKHDFQLSNVVADWVYLTSLGNEWKQPYAKVLSWAKEKNVKIAFSPGTHQMECFDDRKKDPEGARILQEILQNTHILFLNKEEGERVVMSTGQEMDHLLKDLQKMGPKIVSLTDGEHGSWVIDEKGSIIYYSAPQCEIVEKTGAGDAYAAGFLAAVMKGKDLKTAMEWGSKNAASVMEKVGAQTGLLQKEQMHG